MRHYKSRTFAQVYYELLNDLMNNPEYVCSPRDQKINEIMNVVIEIEDPTMNLYTNTRRSSQMKYIAAELVYYFSGRNDLEYIEKYAKFWKDIANEDGTVNSAYGNLIFNCKNEHGLTQWEWAFNSLKNDKDSRQSLLHFNAPRHQFNGNKDFVCTLNGIFHIRNNKLDFTVEMRSNDGLLGAATDCAFFTILQQQMYNLLKPIYPDLKLGKYVHIVNSMHLYERNFKVVKEMLEGGIEDFKPVQGPILSENLVDEKGAMTPMMNSLHNAVVDGYDKFYSGDQLITWMHENVNLK